MTSSIKTVLFTLSKLYKYGIPSHILFFGASLGDNLLLTILAKKLHHNNHKKAWIKCDYPELFENNPYIGLVVPYSALLSTHVLKLFGVKIIPLKYTDYNPATDQSTIPEKHIVLKMADCLSLRGNMANKPDLFLTKQEVANGRYSQKQIAITVSNVNNPVKNKEWVNSRYQQIVDMFTPEYYFIQLGSANDYPLQNVTDLRGKATIRESAAILKNACLLIAYAGFTMHLARAVDCRAVIIYGGRETPQQTGYDVFCNIYNKVHCSPCWLNNRCDYGRMCMTEITTDVVANAVVSELHKINQPLITGLLNNE